MKTIGKFPLRDCQTDPRAVLIFTTLDHSKAKVRLRKIIELFVPPNEGQPMDNNVAVTRVDTNHTFEALIDFVDIRTAEDLFKKVDSLRLAEDDEENKHSVLANLRIFMEYSETYFYQFESLISNKTKLVIIFLNNELGEVEEKRYFNYEHRNILLYLIEVWTHINFGTCPLNEATVDDNFSFNHYLATGLCDQCVKGWALFDQPRIRSCYKIEHHANITSTEEAKQVCERMKASPVVVQTEKELQFLTVFISEHLQKFYRHLDDVSFYTGMSFNLETLNNFKWVNGRPNTFNLPGLDRLPKERAYVLRFERSDTESYRTSWVVFDEMKQGPQFTICESEVINKTKVEKTYQLSQSDLKRRKKPFIFREEKHTEAILFKCLQLPHKPADQELVPYGYLCDTVKDCSDLEDEELCIKENKGLCAGGILCPASLFFHDVRDTCLKREQICDGVQDCLDNSDEENCLDCMETETSEGACLPTVWFSNGSKPFSQRYILTGRSFPHHTAACDNQDICFFNNDRAKIMTRCHSDAQGQGNSWAARCIYLRGHVTNQILGCKDLSHVKDCEDFKCGESFYKCDLSYCVPIYLVNDGVRDCPLGDDELEFILEEKGLITEALIPCRKPGSYIHSVHLCDGQDQCKTREDELLCHEKCPSGFTCLWGAAQVSDHSKVNYTHLFQSFDRRTTAVIVSGLNLAEAKIPKYVTIRNLLELHLSNCNLKEDKFMQLIIAFRNSLYNTYLLDLSYNQIYFNNFDIFSPFLRNIRTLKLSHTLISSIYVPLIAIPDLYTLDLSFTLLKSFRLAYSGYVVHNLNISFTQLDNFLWAKNKDGVTYDILDLRGTKLNFDPSSSKYFQHMTIQDAIYGDSYKLCCEKFRGPGIAEKSCHAPSDSISSCDNLLGDVIKRTLIWLVAMVGSIGNVVVLGYRLISEKNHFKHGHMIFVINLGLSDLLMSVYLMIIAGADVKYRDNYVFYDTAWRESSLCMAAGFIATLSSESSTMFVLLITLERYLIFRNPLKQVKFSPKVLKVLLAIVWTSCPVISLIPVLIPEWQVFSSSSVCLGLPISIKHELGRVFSLTLYIIVNSVLILLIIVGQIMIFKSILLPTSSIINTSVQRRREITVAQNLSLVVVSNILCWLPVCVVGLMSYAGQTFSPDTHGWLAIIVLPLNSAVNPIAYTLPMVYAKYQGWRKDRKRE